MLAVILIEFSGHKIVIPNKPIKVYDIQCNENYQNCMRFIIDLIPV